MRDALQDFARWVGNAEGRDTRHIGTGVAVCTLAVAVSALTSRKLAPSKSNPKVRHSFKRLDAPGFEPPAAVFAAVWPPLFLSLIVSGVRVWNAPDSEKRTRALGLWGAIQALDVLWLAWGPKRLGAQLLTAGATLATAAAYRAEAGQVDPAAAGLVTPYVGWIAFANLVTEEFWRKNPRSR